MASCLPERGNDLGFLHLPEMCRLPLEGAAFSAMDLAAAAAARHALNPAHPSDALHKA